MLCMRQALVYHVLWNCLKISKRPNGGDACVKTFTYSYAEDSGSSISKP